MKILLTLSIMYNAAVDWQLFFQNPSSTAMEKMIDLHNDIMLFLIFVMFFISWMLVRCVYLFRTSNKKTLSFSFQHHTRLEQIWTMIPAIILLLMSTPSFSLLYAMDELSDPKLTVHCIGNQWFWTYSYPDFVKNGETINFDSYMVSEENLNLGGFRLLEVDNQMHLPISQSMRLLITSSDVLHSWAVPSLGIKMDACPGRTNQAALFITKSGTFYGQCSELCGVQHAFMPIVVKATNLPDFLYWTNQNLE